LGCFEEKCVITVRGSGRSIWSRVRSPLLMAAVVVGVAAIPGSILADSGRVLLFSLVVVIAAATDGRRAALVAALIAVAYLAYGVVQADRQEGPVGEFVLGTFAVAALLMAFVVGGLRRRLQLTVERLEAEQRRLQDTVLDKTNFMSAAAHELRTPLTVIRGYLSMLLDGDFGPPSPRWPRVLDTMRSKTADLAGLVEQMLVAVRIDSGTIASAAVEFDLREAVRQAVERAEPSATLARASLTYQLPSRPVTVTADKDHVAAILDGLIANALAAAEGRPWVRVTVTDDGDAEALVEDRGRAIPPEMQTRVFERFVRVDDPSPTSRSTGLALAVSRDLARQHGGDLLLLSSESGVGTVFALRLPHGGAQTGEPDTLVDAVRRGR
jgi:signal transduction histidine kinase